MNRSSDGFYPVADEFSTLSGVSWAAIFAGAAAAAALSLILVLLGFGLGFSAVSPWAHEGVSVKSLGISTIVWLAFTQIVASTHWACDRHDRFSSTARQCSPRRTMLDMRPHPVGVRRRHQVQQPCKVLPERHARRSPNRPANGLLSG